MRRGRPKGARRKDVFILLLYIIKWLYAWILPMGGIVLALILLLCYMFRKHSPGRWALTIVMAAFYLLSIEPVSNALIHPLETAYDQPQGAAVDGDVIVLLGGGSRAGVPDFDGTGQVGSAAANRFLMALRLQKAKDCQSSCRAEPSSKAMPMNRKLKSGCSSL